MEVLLEVLLASFSFAFAVLQLGLFAKASKDLLMDPNMSLNMLLKKLLWKKRLLKNIILNHHLMVNQVNTGNQCHMDNPCNQDMELQWANQWVHQCSLAIVNQVTLNKCNQWDKCSQWDNQCSQWEHQCSQREHQCISNQWANHQLIEIYILFSSKYFKNH